MNKKITSLLFFVFLSFIACSSEGDGDLTGIVLDKNYVSVGVGETAVVKVLLGKGTYVATPDKAGVASVTVNENEISITGMSAGETTINIKDKENLTGSVKVTVTDDAVG